MRPFCFVPVAFCDLNDYFGRSKKGPCSKVTSTTTTDKSQKKRTKRDVSGWLVLNKPYDVASTQAVGKIRWLLSAKKAGHAGTLDPLATGILPIAIGEATKTIPFVQDGMKIYRFALIWGAATSTDDREGEIIATSDHRPAAKEVATALGDFVGEIVQVPPAFSAIRIKGERAYDLARAGHEVNVPPRQVFIERFDLVEHGPDQSLFEVECAKGTYVRSLARDLAQTLGTKGHVGSLHRARVGDFSDADSIDLKDFEAATLDERDKMLLPVSAGLSQLPEIIVDAAQVATIRFGNPVLLTGANAPIALDDAWASHKGQAVAIGYVDKGQFKPTRVILPH
ncbi:tRNA pseudouridine(55) synthase [hydrothermal vent metagenome]|uniref:tRNA pseudouridine(55) synthase n=1 Tax=hydrothermal vent metagenome TaxID=652676 RepID=A0A3B0UAY3_9ZZZZ